MKRKWAGWLSTYSFLLHFRFSPLPQFSVYFSCENPVGSKDVFRYNSKMGQKQKNLWHKNGTRSPLGYLRFHKARTKYSLLKMFRTMKNKIKSYKYLKYFFLLFQISLRATVASSVVRTTDVFRSAGTAMATRHSDPKSIISFGN